MWTRIIMILVTGSRSKRSNTSSSLGRPVADRERIKATGWFCCELPWSGKIIPLVTKGSFWNKEKMKIKGQWLPGSCRKWLLKLRWRTISIDNARNSDRNVSVTRLCHESRGCWWWLWEAACLAVSQAETAAAADPGHYQLCSILACEWLSSFLTAHQHIGYSVP